MNEPNTLRCTKCGIGLGHQVREDQGAARGRTRTIIKGVIWVVVLAVLVAIAPGIFHTAKGKYLKFHLDSVTANAVAACGGPITEGQSYKQAEYDKCMAADEDLAKAHQDWDAFNQPAKP